MKLLEAIRARDVARDKLNAATTAKARAAAVAEFDKACMALARAQVASGVRAEEEPKKPMEEEEEEEEEKDSDSSAPSEEDEEEKAEKTEDDDSSSDSDDSESDDSEEEDEESEEEDEEKDSDDSEEEDEEEEDEEEEEEEEKEEKLRQSALASARSLRAYAKKNGDKKLLALARKHVSEAKAAFATPKSVSKLRQIKATVQKVTGKKGTKQALGALEGLSALPAQVEKLAARDARSKVRERKARVEKLLSENRGRFASSEREHLRETAMKLGSGWLRANLEARPKNIRTITEGPIEGKSYSETPPQKAPASQKYDLSKMSAEQRKVVESAALDSQMSVEEYVALMNNPQAARTRKPSKAG